MIAIINQAIAYKGDPYLYIAVSKNYPSNPDRLVVKVGMSRSMGNRRRALRCHYQGYEVETIDEQLIPYTLDRWLEQLEADLICWLHQAPTNEWKSDEQVEVDYHIAEMLTLQFKDMVTALTQYYEGRQ